MHMQYEMIKDVCHMFRGLHHAAIIVSSEKSVDFYTRLGFAVRKRIDRPNDQIVLMTGNRMELELFIDPTHHARDENPEQLGLRHLVFKVDSIEEVTKIFSCDPIRKNWEGQRFTFTRDPDNLVIEFLE